MTAGRPVQVIDVPTRKGRGIAVALPDGTLILYANGTKSVMHGDTLEVVLRFLHGEWAAAGPIKVDIDPEHAAEGEGWRTDRLD